MTDPVPSMQSADSVRALTRAKPGDVVTYFRSDASTGLLMEARLRTGFDGRATAQSRDADDIASVAAGLWYNGFGQLTQKRRGPLREDGQGDCGFDYFFHVTKPIFPQDIKRARETVVRPIIESKA